MTQLSKPVSPREVYINEQKSQFGERRDGFYKAHSDRGLIDSVHTAVSKLQVVSTEEVRRFLLIGNERAVGLVKEYETNFGSRLHGPEWAGGYARGIKECVDARVITTTIFDYMRRTIVHERTAGIGVRSGHVFRQLSADGIGYVLAHTGCGGEKVAHQAQNGGFDAQNMHLRDAHIDRIIESIPAGIGRIKDPHQRSKANAIIQAHIATLLLQEEGSGNHVYPAMLKWDDSGTSIEVLWLSDVHSVEHPSIHNIRSSTKILWECAVDLAITSKDHYALAAFYYDPYRLGRINSPHAIFDLLPNMGFAVTENFSQVESGGSLSGSAVGSLRYAVSHADTGHVNGVGGIGGNKTIVILDTSADVLRKVKQLLCESTPELRDQTRNGDTILLALYDPATKKVSFI